MAQKDDIAMRRASLLKAARSMVRLRHSLSADAELNELLPLVERRFDREVQAGTLPGVAELLSEYIHEPSE